MFNMFLSRFIERAMLYKYNTYYFKMLYLNTVINSEATALENFYVAMVYLAFKFDAVVMERYNAKIKKRMILRQIQKIVYHYSWRSYRTIQKSKGVLNVL